MRSLFLAACLVPVVAFAQDEGPTPEQPTPEPAPEQPAPEPTPAPTPAPETIVVPPATAEAPSTSPRGGNHVVVYRDERGFKLQADGHDVFIKGVNWGYVPIGTNYSYDFWNHDDDWIKAALDEEMTLLVDGGFNTIRLYDSVPPRWVEYIYDTYGVWTMVNNTAGRYGLTIDGAWVPNTDYSDPKTRDLIKSQVLTSFERFKDTRGMLFWLLGNENNYGLHWSSFEIEDLPAEEQGNAKAKHLYSLFGELIDAIHVMDDRRHPVAIANGDVQYIDLVAEHCPNLDIFGSNVYRGASSRDLFDVVAAKLDVPFVYTEFGADAYNAKEEREDHLAQAGYLRAQWQEIYEMAYGQGKAGNAIGGYVFQWTDGWWKYLQEINLDVQDTNASWATGAYPHDYVEGQNNMNEEWFGITAKGPTQANGRFKVYPRAAYYVLRDGFELDPYAPETTPRVIADHFAKIRPRRYDAAYTTGKMTAVLETIRKSVVTNVRAELQTITTTDDKAAGEGKQALQFDHMESFYLDVGVTPIESFRANVSVNFLGNVASNPIDDIFYEKRGRDVPVQGPDGEEVTLKGLERVKIHHADFAWDTPYFSLDGFYRTGHLHWGYDGDFFGLYRDAYYGENLDIYDAGAPFGLEFKGKKFLEGLWLAAGPQIFWGANPSVIVRYGRTFGPFTFTVMHQEDIAAQARVSTTNAVPEQVTRKTTAYFALKKDPVKVEIGGIFAGTDKLGDEFVAVREAEEGEPSYGGTGYHVLRDQIGLMDTLGAKAKVTIEKGPVHFYVQGAYKGLVADGGPDPTLTFTGWRLKEDGRGNQFNVLAGVAVNLGIIQLAPNFLYQKPLEGPVPAVAAKLDPQTGRYVGALRARNVQDDPFVVRGNRETLGVEFMLAIDPTPATFMWQWDNDIREDAPFAASIDFAYRRQPTTLDSSIGFLADGTLFAFGAAPEAADAWELNVRTIAVPSTNVRLVTTVSVGQGQARGSDSRVVRRGAVDWRLWAGKFALKGFVKINDWGPFDFHRDFNQTFPLQLYVDGSIGLFKPRFFVAETRLGLRAKARWLDQYSANFVRDPTDPDALGYEVELGAYVNISL